MSADQVTECSPSEPLDSLEVLTDRLRRNLAAFELSSRLLSRLSAASIGDMRGLRIVVLVEVPDSSDSAELDYGHVISGLSQTAFDLIFRKPLRVSLQQQMSELVREMSCAVPAIQLHLQQQLSPAAETPEKPQDGS